MLFFNHESSVGVNLPAEVKMDINMKVAIYTKKLYLDAQATNMPDFALNWSIDNFRTNLLNQAIAQIEKEKEAPEKSVMYGACYI